MSETYYREYKKRKRRLKPKVKRVFIILVAVIVVLILRPWRLLGTTDSIQAHEIPVDTVKIPLNQIVQNSDSDIPEAEKFDKTVNAFIRQWNIVGASLAIMKDGNLIYSKGYGMADREGGDSTEVRHIFRVASASKLITATAIMHLYDKGLLKMNSKVFGKGGILSQYKGYTDKRIEKINIEQLLRHKAGFSVRAGDPMFDPSRMGVKLPVTGEGMVDFVLKRGLGYTPGGQTRYSNVGYLILSQIVEKLTFQPYERYVKDSILAPVGCMDMHIGEAFSSKHLPNEVHYYEDGNAESISAHDGSGRKVAKSNGGNDIKLLSGAGGWVCSAVEMLKFVAAIDYENPHDNILSKKAMQLMTSGAKGEMPIGWSNMNDSGDWWRSGSMAGTSTMLRRQSNGYTWIFITNTSSWKGAHFPRMINAMMQNAFDKVTKWPDKDLFQADSLAEEMQGGNHPSLANKNK